MTELLRLATAARAEAPPPGDERYLAYCARLASELAARWDVVLAANADDLDRARAAGVGPVLLDRLTLNREHLERLTALTKEVQAAVPSVTAAGPVTAVGPAMAVRRLPKPLGIVLMIYEARPTVTVEGALLPVAVGNVALLRGGSEMASTNAALGAVATAAAAAAGLPPGMTQVLPDGDRAVVRELLTRHDVIDALIPRGSPALIDHCRSRSSIPVIASGGGVNHLYVDASADLPLAAAIALDSKLAEPTACNTLELVLAHEAVATRFVELLAERGSGGPWTLRLDPSLPAPRGVDVTPLGPHDDGREFLDRTIGVRPVAGIDEAVAHIRRHGSGHTEGVAAADPAVVARFLRSVDAAALVVNGSLRLHDGPTMGRGPELSISTGRLHVRGPVDLSALLTYSWVIDGRGSLRGGDAP